MWDSGLRIVYDSIEQRIKNANNAKHMETCAKNRKKRKSKNKKKHGK